MPVNSEHSVILTTDRLILREISDSDLNYIRSLFNESSFMMFFPEQKKLEKTEAWIKCMIESYKTNGYGFWICELKPANVFIGHCGFLSLTESDNRELELGYSILRKYRNIGYATEAAKACVAYAIQHLSAEKIIAKIESYNIASVHVAEKAGLKFEKSIKLERKKIDMYSVINHKSWNRK